MEDERSYQRWFVTPQDLFRLTPEKALELITKCFYEAQRETLAGASKKLGHEMSEEQLRAAVTSGVRLACKEQNVDCDHPTKEGLELVVQALAKKAATWGTPEDIVHHHQKQIQKVLDHL